MNYFDAITRIATGIGSVGILIGLLIAYKSGLLSFVWNLKKNGNGDSSVKDSYNQIAGAIIAQNERIENLQNNHVSHLKDDINEVREMMKELKDDLKELRKNITDHAEKDALIQGQILAKLENYGK